VAPSDHSDLLSAVLAAAQGQQPEHGTLTGRTDVERLLTAPGPGRAEHLYTHVRHVRRRR
jgi:hypothetical protein